MPISNYFIIGFILIGAFIMLVSARYVQNIFNLLPNNDLKQSWKKLRILILVFFIGYLLAALVVVLGETGLLALLSGVIFLMGSLFVLIVVKAGLDSFKKLNELHQNLDDTELKNKELQKFAYVTSHDLKTPLRGISSLTSFIKEDLEAGEIAYVHNHLSEIQHCMNRLENMINGILLYSKIGRIQPEKINLNTLIQEEFDKYKNQSNIECVIKGKLPTIDGDRIQLSQVMSNLINNAVKYNDKDVCEISVYSSTKSNFHEIIFEDNGTGIDAKYHQKIFEVFQTLSEQDNDKNVGIGLSIVKKIIEKHHGTIRVKSNGILGTQFIISYPIHFVR